MSLRVPATGMAGFFLLWVLLVCLNSGGRELLAENDDVYVVVDGVEVAHLVCAVVDGAGVFGLGLGEAGMEFVDA